MTDPRGHRFADTYATASLAHMVHAEDGLDAVELGAIIRERRHAQGMSLSQLAEQAGVSTSFVSQVERGVANPTLSSLK
jgi:predicted transcriptional regulator